LMMQQLTGKEPQFKHISDLQPESSSEQFLFIFLSSNNLQSHKTEQDFNYFMEVVAGEDKTKREHLMTKKVFKIKKYPVPYHLEPHLMRELINYNFFGKNSDTGKYDLIKPFDAENNVNRAYWYKLSEVAYSIYRVLESIELRFKKTKNAPTIYLADTGPDLMLHRLVIKRELERLNYKILPDKNLPADREEMKVKIKEDLKNSDLLLHMIGQFSSDEFEDGKTVAEIQAAVASEMNEHNECKCARLTWLPPGLQITENKQKLFSDSLKREMESIENCDIVQTNIEDLKAIVDQKFNKKVNQSEVNDVSLNDNIIYLIYDFVDKAKGEAIAEQLEHLGYQVINSEFSGNFIDLREKHSHSLKKFDKAIIFCDNSNNNWLKMKLMDLLKSSGIGRNKSLLVKVVLTTNANINLEQLSKFKFDTYTIGGDGDFNFEQWQEIMSEFNELLILKSY
ncbi:MAG: hypothetical protein ACOCWM_02420, partial [Cyclobacteriaceae bacterium]